MVAMETRALALSGLDTKPGTCILLQATGALGVTKGEGTQLGSLGLDFHIGLPFIRLWLLPLESPLRLTLSRA